MDERIKLIELICDYFGMNINQIEDHVSRSGVKMN